MTIARNRSSATIAALAAAAALALTGCSGTSAPPPAGSPSPTAAAVEPGTSTAPPAEGTADPGAADRTLVGTVGTDADPDAYAIALTDANGEPVTSLPAGDYTLTILDPSTVHNFRLTGAGVDVSSDVGAVEELEVEVTLVAGTYEFVCDPHVGTMRGSLEVTG